MRGNPICFNDLSGGGAEDPQTEPRLTPAVPQTKKTEKNAIEEAVNSENPDVLTPDSRTALLKKVTDKTQTNRAARKIAAKIETETEELVKRIPDQKEEMVRQAIKNYVARSTAIQEAARANRATINQNVLELDFALNTIRAQIPGGEKRRITYRSVAYDNVATIPYGSNVGNAINVNDFVGDLGFVSTSEHRHFVLGKTQTKAPAALLRQVIYSFSGVPVALHFPGIAYSNANEEEMRSPN